MEEQLDDEGADGSTVSAGSGNLAQNRLFGDDMVHLFQANDVRLLEHLERVHFVDLGVEFQPAAVWALLGVHGLIVDLANLDATE